MSVMLICMECVLKGSKLVMKVSVGKEAAPDPLITFASGVGAGMGAASSTLGHQQAQKGGAALP